MSIKLGAVLLLLLSGHQVCSGEDREVIVDTQNGLVRGVREVSHQGVPYMAFHSIPYAKPPIGPLRFNFPEPVEPWNYVLDATVDGPECLQVSSVNFQVIGSEDCLWLSVFTPHLRPEEKLPVLVWVHGGSYMRGTAKTYFYSPSYLMDYGNVIVVSVQYRVGALGFLSTGDAAAPGNYGLHDQTLALKWIEENIATFGGDPEMVTLLGHSAGGASVHGHMVSPQSEGLFQQVIALSGVSIAIWNARYPLYKNITEWQAKEVGCPASPSEALIDCLRTVDAKTLTVSQNKLFQLFSYTSAKMPMQTYTPVVDPFSPRPFFPKDPTEAMRAGQFSKDIPLLTGTTSMEGIWYTVGLIKQAKQADMQALTPEIFVHLAGPGIFTLEDAQEMQKVYLDGQPISFETRIGITEFLSDILFNYEGLLATHLHAKWASSNPIYLYHFNYVGDWSLAHFYDPSKTDYGGVSHLDDIRYLMKMSIFPALSDEEETIRALYTSYMVNFAHHGNPTPSQTATQWEPYKAGNAHYMYIGGEGLHPSEDMKSTLPFGRKRMELWHKLLQTKEDWMDDYSSNVNKPHQEL